MRRNLKGTTAINWESTGHDVFKNIELFDLRRPVHISPRGLVISIMRVNILESCIEWKTRIMEATSRAQKIGEDYGRELMKLGETLSEIGYIDSQLLK